MTEVRRLWQTNRELVLAWVNRGFVLSLWILSLAATIMLCGCGGGSSGTTQSSGTLSGNWQFEMTNTADLTVTSGLQGGFLVQNNGSVTGSAVYSNVLLNSTAGPCNSGSAAVTGTISGQNVSLMALAGPQTFTLTGTLNSDGSMSGSYTATAGPIVAGTTTPCGSGTATGTPLPWTAKSVPPLTGSITGSFHSTGNLLRGQDFPVTGNLTQGNNIGASNATVTGTLSFVDPTTLLSDYPCIDTVSVNGQISGNVVVLQLIGVDGANDGQIGVAPSEANIGGNGSPVRFNPTKNGNVLQSMGTGTAYIVNTKACANSASSNNEDIGYICLALNSTTACQQPITLSPAAVSFPSLLLGSTDVLTQTITLTNNFGQELNGLTLTWVAPSGTSSDFGQTDFTNLPNFTEADTCVPGEVLPSGGTTGSSFNLLPGASCAITVSFDPQESCTWLPNNGGTPPAQCPLTLSASLTVNNVPSVDSETSFTVPVTGIGASFIQPSTQELDFGAEAFGEASLPQTIDFTNNAATPVQILPRQTCVSVFSNGSAAYHILPHPLTVSSAVAGLQVVSGVQQDTANSTIDYICDSDVNTLQPSFQISSDSCSGVLLQPQASCSLAITFAPQSPATYSSQAIDYFLELNTVQCTVDDGVLVPPSLNPYNPCELDGGRFPVELKANLPSPLRMSPGAGLDFGTVPVGKSSVPQTITLINDPSITNPQTVTFVGKFVVSGNFSESDNCPFSLAPGGTCTLSVTFKPSVVGHVLGTPNIAINYTTTSDSNFQTQTIYLHGAGQ